MHSAYEPGPTLVHPDEFPIYSGMDTFSLHTISKIILPQWCSCEDSLLQSLWTEMVQMHLWGGRCVLIPLSRCRNRTWEVVSFTDCFFGASPSLITRNVNCLPVNFFQIPVLLPPLCICLYPILDLTLSSLFRYPGRICGRAELNSASKVMMLSLDLSFPSNFNEALVLLTSCPSRAALKFKLMLKY